MRSLSEVILEVVANPRVVMFRAEDSVFENMSWSEIENGRFDCPNVCHPAITIIDDIARDPVAWVPLAHSPSRRR